jgi:hypothetical protein
LAAKNSAVFPHPHHSSDFALCVSEGEIAVTMLLLQKVSFSNTTSNVRTTEPVAYMQKGTTLKGTAFTSNRVTSVWKLLNMPL